MIGFYNYTVILTYLGLASAVFGITQTMENDSRHIVIAVICLLIAGGCDMFDGIVARTKKDRTQQQKVFGIQIDSLCDVICFGVLPAMINYRISVEERFHIIGLLISIFFVLAAVIRLGYFNMLEEERQRTTAEKRKEYIGLPVTSAALFIPVVYLARNIFKHNFYLFLNLAILIIGILFITNFKLKKPDKKGVVVMTGIGFAIIVLLVLKGLHILRF